MSERPHDPESRRGKLEDAVGDEPYRNRSEHNSAQWHFAERVERLANADSRRIIGPAPADEQHASDSKDESALADPEVTDAGYPALCRVSSREQDEPFQKFARRRLVNLIERVTDHAQSDRGENPPAGRHVQNATGEAACRIS